MRETSSGFEIEAGGMYCRFSMADKSTGQPIKRVEQKQEPGSIGITHIQVVVSRGNPRAGYTSGNRLESCTLGSRCEKTKLETSPTRRDFKLLRSSRVEGGRDYAQNNKSARVCGRDS